MVAELNSPEDLVSDLADSLLFKTIGKPLQIIQHCVVNKLKHQIKLLFSSKVFY